MGVAMSIVMIAVGAILRFAVSVTTTGFNLHSIGLILIILGAISLLISILFWSSWGGFGGRRRRLGGLLGAVAASPGPGHDALTQSTAYVEEEHTNTPA
jgi:hypothetical protein